MQIRDIQTALAGFGFDPGPIDNVAGPLTRKAIMAFQQSRGLEVDGVVGPRTRAALFGAPAMPSGPQTTIPSELTWLIEAHRYVDLVEFAGAANNPVIMDWAKVLKIRYAGDSVPWCGLFVAQCITAALPEDPIPTNPLGARNWLRFGIPVMPQFGAMLVFWRVKRDGWQGHVGFYWAEDATHFHVLGGNQSNSVNVSRVAKTRLLGAQWPKSQPTLGITRTATAAGLVTSVNAA